MQRLLGIGFVAVSVFGLAAPGWAITASGEAPDQSAVVEQSTPAQQGSEILGVVEREPVMELSTQRRPAFRISVEQTEQKRGLSSQTVVPTKQRYGEARVPYVELTLARF